MNLVIVEDSYLNVKYKSNFHWLTGEDDEDEDDGPDGQGGGANSPSGGHANHPHGGPGETHQTYASQVSGSKVPILPESDMPVGGFPMLQYMNRRGTAK